MKTEGNLIKMRTEVRSDVQYYLLLDNTEIFVNDLIGKPVRIESLHQINCIKCGRVTKKSFAQGYCYPCFTSSPETDPCILRPELCKAHVGVSRDLEWSKTHCLQEHFVYLALSSGVKVGVTRSSQIPIRWMDQGAIEAIKIAKTPNRHLAGTIEVALKELLPDKTNWRNMLTQKIEEDVNLEEEKFRVIELLPPDMQSYVYAGNEITRIQYPVHEYPQKVTSVSFDKTSVIEGILTGIKGQYLIFENGMVINIRKHNGYKILFEA